jgi:hypothetical protein
MNELLVEYARVSTEQQDLTAPSNGLHALGVVTTAIYVDHGLNRHNRDRPGLRLALAACRAGDTLVVTKLDRRARSLPDGRDTLDELTKWKALGLEWSRVMHRRAGGPVMKLVRYADDFVIMVHGHRSDAEAL